MEELYVEGVATHGGPESCAVVCEGGGESIDRGTRRPGYRATKCAFGVPTLSERRKATSAAALSRGAVGPRVVKEPGHVRNLHAREPGEPVSAQPCDQRVGRPGNAEAVILG